MTKKTHYFPKSFMHNQNKAEGFYRKMRLRGIFQLPGLYKTRTIENEFF